MRPNCRNLRSQNTREERGIIRTIDRKESRRRDKKKKEKKEYQLGGGLPWFSKI